MMGRAATIWSKETGIDRNPADAVEVKRPDDRRDRYLSVEEICRLTAALDEKMFRKTGKRDQSDVLSFSVDRSDSADDGHADFGDLRTEVE